jgi:hypothetical protein
MARIPSRIHGPRNGLNEGLLELALLLDEVCAGRCTMEAMANRVAQLAKGNTFPFRGLSQLLTCF